LLRGDCDSDEDDGKKNDVIEATLYAESLANGRAELRAANDVAQENGVGGGQGTSEHCSKHQWKVEQPCGSRGDEGSGQKSAWAEDEESEKAVLVEIGGVEGDGVHKKDESEAKGGDFAQDGRFESYVGESEAVGADDGAESEENGDLRESSALNEAREKRRNDDDDADEREDGGENFWAEGVQMSS
jgi:hypothetical protein